MMTNKYLWSMTCLTGLLSLAGCGREATIAESGTAVDGKSVADVNLVKFSPGADVQKRVLEELILAEPGTVFEFDEGVYEFTDGLSLSVEGVTLRGRGMDKTIFSFKGQEAGAEGLYITSRGVTVQDLAIEDTKGNGLKSLKADNIVLRRVRAEWTGGPKATNGAYGLYPVSSENVLIEECVAIGASDAGIYVGQSKNVIVRNSQASYNVAGIEIENCHGADVYGNVATNNTGGVLVFDLPDLPVQRGHDVRVFDNKIFNNNTPNFAPEGNIVATVPTGTGVMVMANTNVEIFNNEIRDHQTTNTMIVSYLTTNIQIKDPNYYPYAEQIHIHNNTFGPGGNQPSGQGGLLIAAVTGSPIPDIVWDGVVNPEKMQDGQVIREAGLSIHSNNKTNGEVTFVNLGGLETLKNPVDAKPSRDITAYSEPFPSIAPIKIAGIE
ncbi:MAG: right-handed parallel beta-helix repeat-containing protein [Pirellulaceae bacterium]|nr:right-handed parallel beta-helix repeat-containing protein [Pirellulaceae bacterium]